VNYTCKLNEFSLKSCCVKNDLIDEITRRFTCYTRATPFKMFPHPTSNYIIQPSFHYSTTFPILWHSVMLLLSAEDISTIFMLEFLHFFLWLRGAPFFLHQYMTNRHWSYSISHLYSFFFHLADSVNLNPPRTRGEHFFHISTWQFAIKLAVSHIRYTYFLHLTA
jgi:hypothetical protein